MPAHTNTREYILCTRAYSYVIPRLADVAHDWMVLSAAADVWGEEIFGVTDDAKDFFNQFCIGSRTRRRRRRRSRKRRRHWRRLVRRGLARPRVEHAGHRRRAALRARGAACAPSPGSREESSNSARWAQPRAACGFRCLLYAVPPVTTFLRLSERRWRSSPSIGIARVGSAPWSGKPRLRMASQR